MLFFKEKIGTDRNGFNAVPGAGEFWLPIGQAGGVEKLSENTPGQLQSDPANIGNKTSGSHASSFLPWTGANPLAHCMRSEKGLEAQIAMARPRVC